MLWSLGLIIFLGLIFIGIPIMIRDTANGRYTLSKSIFLYMLYPLPIFFLSYLLFCYVSEDPTIAYNSISTYFVFVGLLLLTPVVIRRYFNDSDYEEKNMEFFTYMIVLTLSGLFGLILFLAHSKILPEFLDSWFWILSVIIIPLIPISICMYYKRRGRK